MRVRVGVGESGLLYLDCCSGFRAVLYAVAYASLHFGSQVGRNTLYLLHDVCRGIRG